MKGGDEFRTAGRVEYDELHVCEVWQEKKIHWRDRTTTGFVTRQGGFEPATVGTHSCCNGASRAVRRKSLQEELFLRWELTSERTCTSEHVRV